MPRRGYIKRREIPPDWKYNSTLITKFINKVMWDGKRTLAEKIVYGALDIIKEKTKEDPLKVLQKAVDNVKPLIETRSRRVGGATYQVPVEVLPHRQISVAVRWIVEFARKRSGKSMKEKLAAEILDAYHNRGASVKKREDTHKMAEANRAFAHFRW